MDTEIVAPTIEISLKEHEHLKSYSASIADYRAWD